MMKLDPIIIQDPMYSSIGETGTAHSPLMFAKALEESKPRDKLLVVSFGSGCDALYFEVTDRISKKKKRNGGAEIPCQPS